MKYVFICILLCIQLQSSSQVTLEPRLFAETITVPNLKHHLEILAGPAMEGRETATNGQRKAAGYIAGEFERMGLIPGWKDGYQQLFPLYQDSLVKAALSVEGVPLAPYTDFVISNNSTFNVSFSASEVLFVGYGRSDSIRDDYKDVNARGKIVMVFQEEEEPASRRTKRRKEQKPPPLDYYSLQDAARRNGAIAMLITDKNFPRPPAPAKGPMYIRDTRKENIPNTFFISDSIARKIMGADYYVARKIMRTDPPPPKSCYVNLQLELDKTVSRLESSNVLGYIEGTDKKEETVVLTAHYDHLGMRDSLIYFGADDDASGVSAVLEIAEAFAIAAQQGVKPRRNVLFMLVSGEEKGLWGSSYYSENPAFPLERTSANVNIDMIGRIEKGRGSDSLNYIFVVGDNRLSSDLRSISESINRRYSGMHLDYRFNDPNDPQRIFYRSDHYNFAKKGVPAIFYFSGLHDDYHKPSDTPDKINYELLAKRAQLIFYTAWEIVNRDEMLKRDLD